MKLSVNVRQRMAKCRAHTATHLMHAEIQKIILDTKQEGSFVGEDELRFDFSSDQLLDQRQLGMIQYNVNSAISGGFPVEIFETSMDEAQKMGAKAFFQDKYGDVVRVVKIGRYDDENMLVNPNYSVELCGGTHVQTTNEIGGFAIVSQSAVATGVKRITAYTGPKLVEYLKEKQNLIDMIADKFETHEKQLEDKIEKTLKHLSFTENTLKLLNTDFLSTVIQTAPIFQGFAVIDTRQYPALHTQTLASVVASVKDLQKNSLIIGDGGAYAVVSTDSTAKSFAQGQGLKGGGQDSLFQGKDEKVYTIIS